MQENSPFYDSQPGAAASEQATGSSQPDADQSPPRAWSPPPPDMDTSRSGLPIQQSQPANSGPWRAPSVLAMRAETQTSLGPNQIPERLLTGNDSPSADEISPTTELDFGSSTPDFQDTEPLDLEGLVNAADSETTETEPRDQTPQAVNAVQAHPETALNQENGLDYWVPPSPFAGPVQSDQKTGEGTVVQFPDTAAPQMGAAPNSGDDRQPIPEISPLFGDEPSAESNGRHDPPQPGQKTAPPVAETDVGISIGLPEGARQSSLAGLASLMANPTERDSDDSRTDNDNQHKGNSLARSARTEKMYAERVRQLYKRSTANRTTDPQQPANVSPLDVTNDLIAAAETKSPASWNLYRAALLWHLAINRNSASVFQDAYVSLAATRQLGRNAGRTAARGTPGRTKTQLNKKGIPEDDLNQLIDVLGGMNRTTNWGSRTQFWLLAGLASGARPGEWFGASWLDDSKQTLCIPNGKRKRTTPIFKLVPEGKTIHDVEADRPELLTPGTEFDDTKRIRNVPIDPAERIYVSLHLGALNDYLDKSSPAAPSSEVRQERFVSYYNLCRKVLRKACIQAFNGKKSYSLYVMRSQFTANKKAEMPLKDVAELLGHERSGRTTMANYGPMKIAHGGRGTHAPGETQSFGNQAQSDPTDAAPATPISE